MFKNLTKKLPMVPAAVIVTKLLTGSPDADAQWCNNNYTVGLPPRQPIYTQAFPESNIWVTPVYPYHPYGSRTSVFVSYTRTRVVTEPRMPHYHEKVQPAPELKEEDALKMIEDYLNDHGLAWEEDVNVGTTVVDIAVNDFPSPGQKTGIEYNWDELKKKLVERSTLYRCVLVGTAASGEEMLDGVDREMSEILDSSSSPKSNVKPSSKKKHH